ncbi:pro-thyrotropin-releasing hormone [Erpetoichthys calabaricus]|uniref:Pro-thyrotropin-releasing hormone n=1 Tax=Erpetoichthys calabaricus TaxID=27687 RepID=A0A8C4TFW8_ERPCA|nr:pro-thyrotropin-releasing hormone [Erpetoichthys calabaricus]
MRSTCLILLAFLTAFNLTVNVGQHVAQEEDPAERVPMDEILQRAENLIIRSILRKIEDDSANEQELLAKRQHPGKRFQDTFEKRQHPGKRDEEENEDDLTYMDFPKRPHPLKKEEEEEDYSEFQKRQHPGKRDEEADTSMDLQKRQHPGRRALWEQYSDIPGTQAAYLHELSRRQHPGRRFVGFVKRQHPGKRSLEDQDVSELQDVDKRQHPGKRTMDLDSPDYNSSPPCDIQELTGCSKASLLLELLDNVNKSRGEEKRQHPGRRFVFDADLAEQE